MNMDEASYFTRRAVAQMELASDAAGEDIGRVHARLSDLYLERARSLVAHETSVGLEGNVVPLRIGA